MTRRILQSALLSLSVSLTGCIAYDFDQPGYAYSRYSGYGYQQPVYQTVHYREYPVQQTYRYPVRVTPVYVYRQPSVRYWPAQQQMQNYGVRNDRDEHWRAERYGHEQRYERYRRDDRDERHEHDSHRGWGEDRD